MANLNSQSLVNVLETTDASFDFDIYRGLDVFLRAFGKAPPSNWILRDGACTNAMRTGQNSA